MMAANFAGGLLEVSQESGGLHLVGSNQGGNNSIAEYEALG